jgi:HEAT repeat protein
MALRDESADIRWFAALGLGTLGDPGAIEPLEAVLLVDRDERVRTAATEALKKIRGEEPVK